MRIVLLSHAPARGGSTDMLVQVRDYFLQHGHAVQCIFSESAQPADPRVQDAPIVPISPHNWRGHMTEYLRMVEAFRPDVVYAISGKVEMDLFRFLRCVRARHIFSLEEHEFLNIPFLLKKGRRFIEACTANTPDAQARVKEITGLPTYHIPYLIPEPLHQIEEIDGARLLDPKNPVEIAMVTRFDRLQKRSHWFAHIIRQCEAAGANLVWHFYGDGPNLASVQAALQGNRRVHFHGWVSRETLYEKLPAHDILFYCSRWEGLPLSLVEGMRCGLACVSTDIPAGIRWTLEQGGGWLYNAKTASDAARALTAAVQDRALILEKRREALKLAAKLFTMEKAGQCFQQLEENFARLKFNGHALDLSRARKLRAISVPTFLKRLVVKPQR